MRSRAFEFRLEYDTPVNDGGFGENVNRFKRVTVAADGTFTVLDGDYDNVKSYHLDTDSGFELFVSLLQQSAERKKAREIKNALYILPGE